MNYFCDILKTQIIWSQSFKCADAPGTERNQTKGGVDRRWAWTPGHPKEWAWGGHRWTARLRGL